MATPLTTEQRVSRLENYLKALLGATGLTIGALLYGAYWLGTLNTTVLKSSEKVDKVYSIVLENKDSLTSRTSIIETKLDVLDKKLV